MTEVYIYIMGSNTNTDIITCSVPDISNDNEEIFFGPCKKNLRKHFRERFIESGKLEEENSIYIVGLSAATRDKKRCILWAGKVTKVMTFAQGHDYIMQHERDYSGLLKRQGRCALHIEPIRSGKKLVGYKYRKDSNEHEDTWVSDLTSESKKYKQGPEIRFEDCASLDRDCVFFCERLFWATRDLPGIVIEKNDDFVNALRVREKDTQKRKNIDDYFVFGKTKRGGANGLRGGYLPVKDRSTAEKIIHHIKKEAKHQRASKNATPAHPSKC